MPIKVYSDRIELGNKIIRASANGIIIDDALAANTQQQGYVKQANFTARELAFGNFGFQGSVAGYNSGGGSPSYPNFSSNTIQKFPFATSTTNAVVSAGLTVDRWGVAGCSSSIHGYAAGGNTSTPPTEQKNTIDKFPFSTDTNATDVGDLTSTNRQYTGQSSSVNGYVVGGIKSPPNVRDGMDKFPFATDVNATSIGVLSVGRYASAGQSSTTHGYTSGGSAMPTPGDSNIIDKFPFASDTNATDVGDLTQARSSPAGQSSTTHGYSSGGLTSPPEVSHNTIDKFPFSTDTNATDVGDLTQARRGPAGQSSTSHGYTSGGYTTAYVNTIDRFPFSSDTNASDVGDLVAVTSLKPAGQQF